MYITINDIIGEKRIDLSYPIKGKDGPAEGPYGPGVTHCQVGRSQQPQITVVSMLSDNVQYWLWGSVEVLLKMGKK